MQRVHGDARRRRSAAAAPSAPQRSLSRLSANAPLFHRASLDASACLCLVCKNLSPNSQLRLEVEIANYFIVEAEVSLISEFIYVCAASKLLVPNHLTAAEIRLNPIMKNSEQKFSPFWEKSLPYSFWNN